MNLIRRIFSRVVPLFAIVSTTATVDAFSPAVPALDWANRFNTTVEVPPKIAADLEIGPTTHDIHIFNFDFSLNQAGEPIVDPVILLGDSVRWIWDEGVHSTTAAAGQAEFWDSGVLSGATFSHLFTQTGAFDYYSAPFGFDNGDTTAGGMSGTVTVVPEPAAYSMVLAIIIIFVSLMNRRC